MSERVFMSVSICVCVCVSLVSLSSDCGLKMWVTVFTLLFTSCGLVLYFVLTK